MKVLVTGATGFLGAPLVTALCADGHEVIALSRAAAPAWAARPGLRWWQRDLLAQGFDAAPFDSLDAVIHLAALKEPPANGDVADLVAANETLTLLVWRGVRPLRPRFIFASTQMVYGDPGSDAVDESFPLRGMESSAYACSKVNAENWLRNSTGADDECLALRLCGFVEGGGNIDYMIARASAGESIELFSRGAVCRDYLSLADGVLALRKALTAAPRKGYRAINVGSGQKATALELASAVRAELGSRSEILLSDRPAPRSHFVFDITRARQELGFEPRSLIDAVRAHARGVNQLARRANG